MTELEDSWLSTMVGYHMLDSAIDTKSDGLARRKPTTLIDFFAAENDDMARLVYVDES